MFQSFRSFAVQTPRYRVTPAYPACIHEPTVYSADDVNAVNGHGFGFGDGVAVKAIGEYLERYAAFRAVTHRKSGAIADMGLGLSERQALVQALRQTCNDNIRDDIEAHSFRLVEVTRLGTDHRVHYPAVFLSLHSFDGQIDSSFLPVRDTSGSAIHRSRAAALRGALLEFVERQCTTAMWVSRRCNDIQAFTDKLKDKKAIATHNQMAMNGNIRVLDLSFIRGVSVQFCEYSSKSEGAVVNFSCGCAADFDAETALMKAFTETWQTSLLLPQMEFFGSRDYGSNALKQNFQAANRPEFDLGVQKKPIEFGSTLPGNDLDNLIQNIQTISENVYVYFRELNIAGAELHFCRVVSPDFFIHMSPGESNNNENAWINSFCKASERRLEPMPFS
ncbi:YcaO-like family protein [Rhizobium herbae]|uniref:YcaO-like family protein n=1 Tax=Rhizobium herbae TaxID=508661 RepID=A0ABS7HBL0_9HYPH|nr:YcaO-like family protein [Rhizobium herbae]MBW9064656.1 YcaO-like family protein [Rhizobium herbae]